MPLPCIYCEERFDFTNEHVVPACIGGDDPNWLLKDCVCAGCNHSFSPLEAQFSRNSPVAFGRNIEQPTGRDRGKATRAPTLRLAETTIIDGSGAQLVGEMRSKFSVVIAAQVQWIRDGELQINGSDASDIESLIAILRSLSDPVVLIEKISSNVYLCTDLPLALSASRCARISTERSAPPKSGVWLQQTQAGIADRRPKLFLQNNQIICRADSEEDAAKILQLARNIRSDALAKATTSHIEQPCVHLQMSIDIGAYERVLAKIGFSLAALLDGLDVARGDAFKSARRFIRWGEGSLLRIDSQATVPPNLVSRILSEQHVLVLNRLDIGDNAHLVFSSWLYGAPQGGIQLATFASSRAAPTGHMVFVNYKTNSIRER